jgi:O-antigen/teichoic acid export membrane protein
MGIFQITVAGTLINLQSDRIVAGLIASPTVVGQLGIASQIAVALRLVAGSAISPILTRLSTIHGRGVREGLLAEFRRVNRMWVLTTVGLSVIVIVALAPLVESWVGPGHGQAAAFGAVLILAYGVNLLAAPGASLLIAIGRPHAEAKYTVITVLLNIAGTVGLGLLFGVMGVVIATAAAYVAGTAWFLLQLRQYTHWMPRDPVRLTARVAVCSFVTAAVAFAWCWLIKETLPSGIAVVPAGLGVSGCLLLYLRLIGVAPELILPRQAIDVKGP